MMYLWWGPERNTMAHMGILHLHAADVGVSSCISRTHEDNLGADEIPMALVPKT